jgi:hypothetical protein
MRETRKTLALAGAALVLAVLAWVTTLELSTPAALQDRGQPFFPEFTDPNAATSLEVVEFDEQTTLARPFKVLNRDGRWTIPSRHNYPADGSRRLPTIAAAVIALKKEDVVSDEPRDQVRCSVLDPLDETLPTTQGRGTRITVKGKNEKMLADIIVGKVVEGRPNLRYVRPPGQRRTYVARIDNLLVSTKFEDWIDRHLLQVERDDIDQILIRNYSTDAESGNVNVREALALRKKGRDLWEAAGMSSTETIEPFKMNLIVTKLVEMEIADVQPKPASVTASLTTGSGPTKLLRADVADLAARGFYFTADGQMLASQGEVVVHTSAGIFYVLRFGGIAQGSGENIYLLVSVGFDSSAARGAVPDTLRTRVEVLRARFAPWYYVVSNDSFKKIRLSRADLIKSRTLGATR